MMLAAATFFQKRHRSLSSSPMMSGLLGLLKLSLASLFPLCTQYKGKPSSREGSWLLAHTFTNFPFQSLYDCWKIERIDLPAIPFRLTQRRSPGFLASNRKRKTSTDAGSPKCAHIIWNALTNAQLLG